MAPDQERWAEALAIERIHGDRAPLWVAERIGALALAGDVAGVERFNQIAKRLDELRGKSVSWIIPNLRHRWMVAPEVHASRPAPALRPKPGARAIA